MSLAPKLAEFAGISTGQRVLDVGCGPGALTAELVRLLGASAVSAVDPSAPFVAAIRERYPEVAVEQASAESLPFADDTFAAAIAQLVVHFMSDPVGGLREMARVTRPGRSRRGLRLGSRRRQRTAQPGLGDRARARSAGRGRGALCGRTRGPPRGAVRRRRIARNRGDNALGHCATPDVRRLVGAVYARRRSDRHLRGRTRPGRSGPASRRLPGPPARRAVRDISARLGGSRHRLTHGDTHSSSPLVSLTGQMRVR